ncbi:LysR substrate-binding domain-containing protein, partial [Photobacterium sanctipauli]
DNHFQALLDGSSDILFAYNTQGMRPSFLIEDKVEKLLVCQEEIIPVVCPALLEQHAADQAYPYLAYSEHTFLHNVVAPLIEKNQCPLNQVFETTLTESLIKMAVNGYGVAWAPRHAIESELAQGQLVRAFPEMPELLITLDIVCYRAKEASRTSVHQFWQGLSQVVESKPSA